MTNFKSLKKLMPLLVLPLASSALATDVTVPLSFETLPVITVTEETPMDFGQVLSLAQAATCTMSAISGAALTQSDEGNPNTTAAGGTLSGDCSGEGQPGIYTIKSVASASIKVSLTAGAATEISFVPSGIVIDYNGGAARDAVTTASPAVVESSATLNAFTAAGTNRVIMGGKITNQQTLVSATAYTTTFDIDVIYQ
jgi:hypothetical protein